MAMNSESPEAEMSRLSLEAEDRESLISARSAELIEEGLADELHGSLAILLNPQMVPEESRAQALVDYILRLVATRELS